MTDQVTGSATSPVEELQVFSACDEGVERSEGWGEAGGWGEAWPGAP